MSSIKKIEYNHLKEDVNNNLKLTTSTLNKILQGMGLKKGTKTGHTGVVGSNNLINHYVRTWEGDYLLSDYTKETRYRSNRGCIEIYFIGYSYKGNMQKVKDELTKLGYVVKDAKHPTTLEVYLPSSNKEDNLNSSLKEDVKQPTQEDINWLRDWLDLDKEKYLKLWDEKNGHAYIVFPASLKLDDFNENDEYNILYALKQKGFDYKLSQEDYTYKTVGSFNGRTMSYNNKGYDRTLKNRVKLDIYWDTQKKDNLNSSLKEDETKVRKVDISHLHDSEIKKLVRSSFKGTQQERRDFNFATSIDKHPSVVKDGDKAMLLSINYQKWNEDRTDKVNRNILAWFPKSVIKESLKNDLNSKDDKSINEGIKSKNKGIRESVESNSEYFTKEEIKTLPNELEKYFQEQRIPKYYSIDVDEEGDNNYTIRGIIDYGELNHDHRYFDDKVKEFFNDKGINVVITEPDDLKGTIDEDGIYSSIHTIKKQVNNIEKE